MVFATILFAGAFIAGKLGSSDFSPIVMTFLRIGLASLLMFPFMVHKEDNWRLSKKELWLAIQLGLIGMTFYHLFFFSALKYTSASNASVINASMPIITAVVAFFLLEEKLNRRQSFFMLTAFIGVVLTIIKWDLNVLFDMQMNQGDMLMLGGTFSWATYGVLIKKSSLQISALKLTTYSLLMCTLIVSPFAIKSILTENVLSVPIKSYYSIIYMALFPTVLGYTIQLACIKELGPSTAALFINLVPIFSIVLSYLILGEAILKLNIISGLIIILSVILFTKAKTILN